MKLDDLTAADVEKIFELYATHCYGRPDKDLLGGIYWSSELDATFDRVRKRGTKFLEALVQSPWHAKEYRFGSIHSPQSKLVIGFDHATNDISVHFFDNLPRPEPAHRNKKLYRAAEATKEIFDKAVQEYFTSREHNTS